MRNVFALLLLAPAFVAVAAAAAAEVRVSAAASLSDALRELGAMHERATGDRVVFNFGASSTLARQIQEGAPADLFFSADVARMEQLIARGLVLTETRRDFLSNTLVIVTTPETRLRVPRDLLRVRRIALADPASVPAGIYAKQYLTALGLWTAIAPNVIPTDNVRAALAAVEAGNADAAIVYRTDARIARNVRVAWEVPRREGPDIIYSVAVLRDAEEPLAARRLLQFLVSRRAADVFRRHGFLLR